MISELEIRNTRKAIQTAISEIAETNISITERVFQSFNINGKHDIPSINRIYSNLFHTFPALQVLYEDLSLDLSNIRDYHMPNMAKPRTKLSIYYSDKSKWKKKLNYLFYQKRNHIHRRKYSAIGNKIISENNLNLNNLIKGILLGGNFAGKPNKLISNMHYEIYNNKLHKFYTKIYNNFSEHLVFKIDEISKIDPSYDDQQFIIYYENNKVKIKPFAAFSLNTIGSDVSESMLARTNIIQNGIFNQDQILELEDMINKNALEHDFQRFFEINPSFITALGDYKAIHSQLVLKEENGSDLIPDFFLEKIDSNLTDICDLKRANVKLKRIQKNRNRFANSIYEAIAQLSFYRDWFEDKRNRDLFFNNTKLKSYRPKVILVIGRNQDYYNDIERIKLEGQIPSWVNIKTYDNILSKARYMNSLVTGANK